MVEKLQRVYNALNTLQVSGRNNCAIVCACMSTVEEVIQEILNQESEQECSENN